MNFEIPRDTLVAIVDDAIETLAVAPGSTAPERLRAVARTTERVYFGDMFNEVARCGCPLVQADILNENGEAVDDSYQHGFWAAFDSLMARALNAGAFAEGLVEVI